MRGVCSTNAHKRMDRTMDKCQVRPPRVDVHIEFKTPKDEKGGRRLWPSPATVLIEVASWWRIAE